MFHDFRSTAFLLDEFLGWIDEVLKLSLDTVELIEGIHRRLCGETGIADEFAHRVEVFLLDITVVVLAPGTASSHREMSVFAIFEQVVVDELAAVVRM